MQRIFQSTLAKRSLFLAAACLLLTTGPVFGETGQGKDTLFSLRHDGRVRTYLVHLPASYSKVTVERYGVCAAGTAVALYTLQDEGHTWPGGTKWAFWADEPSREISATDVIWAFFKDHPRRN